jgi:peroxiredoxin
MTQNESRPTVRPGEIAPDFTLPLVSETGEVSLRDYRGRAPVLLALLRSIWCPFCRRHVGQLGGTREKLGTLGVETLGIIEDRLEPVRRYFQVRPPRIRLATDEARNVHRVYGCPTPPVNPDYRKLRAAVRINPTGEAPEPMSIDDAQTWLRRHDRFGEIPEDQAVMDQFPPRDFNLHAGHFLIDRQGIVRRVWIETPADDLTGWGVFPTDGEILAAVRAGTL